jgi:hypothetical protein
VNGASSAGHPRTGLRVTQPKQHASSTIVSRARDARPRLLERISHTRVRPRDGPRATSASGPRRDLDARVGVAHQSSARPSRKKPPLGPPSSSRAAHATLRAPSAPAAHPSAPYPARSRSARADRVDEHAAAVELGPSFEVSASSAALEMPVARGRAAVRGEPEVRVAGRACAARDDDDPRWRARPQQRQQRLRQPFTGRTG